MADVATLGLTVDATGVVRGVGIATREFDRLGGRSDQAKLNVKGLQGALGSLATTALALPGPLGRVGQILGSFALGGGMMLAVTAGVAAVGAAWQSLSADAEDARRSSKAMADQLMNDSRRLSDYSRAALQVRQATLQSRRDELMQAISNQGQPTPLHPDLSTAAGRFAFGAADAATKATFFFPTVSKEEAEKLYEYDRALREVTRAIKALDEATKPRVGGSAGGRAGRSGVELGPNVTDIELAQAFAKHLARAADEKARLTAGSVDTSGFGYQGGNIPLTSIAQYDQSDKSNAAMYAGWYASSRFGGSAGGTLMGVGQSLMAGNPWMAAAQGVGGLVDSILGMANASEQAAENLRNFRMGLENFVDSMGVATGRLSSSEAERAAGERRYQQERAAAVEASLQAARTGEDAELKRLLELIAQMDADFAKWLDAIEKNTEALTTAQRNAPRGFYVENYIGPVVRPGAGGTNPNRPNDPRGGGDNGMRPGGTVVINVASSDPQVMLRMIVAELRQHGLATGGNGMTNSDVLNRM